MKSLFFTFFYVSFTSCLVLLGSNDTCEIQNYLLQSDSAAPEPVGIGN